MSASRKPIRAYGGVSAYAELSAPLGLMKRAGNTWEKHSKRESDLVRKDKYFKLSIYANDMDWAGSWDHSCREI